MVFRGMFQVNKSFRGSADTQRLERGLKPATTLGTGAILILNVVAGFSPRSSLCVSKLPDHTAVEIPLSVSRKAFPFLEHASPEE